MATSQLLASDNFASGSLAAGWTLINGATQVSKISGVAGFAEPQTTSETDGQVWTGLVWPNDQISEVTVKTLTNEGGTVLVLAARWQQTAVSGYSASINGAGGVTINRVDAGTPTPLVTSSVNVVVATGDVFAFAAQGSSLSVYQNGRRVCYAGDSIYTLGYPGFYSSSTVNITHTQVSEWRGYNSVQQDGIWTKGQVVFPPTNAAPDNALTGIGVYEAFAMRDNNPQILAGPNVYKLWFSAGAQNAAGIYYAESPDLVTWTRQVAAVFASGATPTIMKVGATYYIYYQLGNAQGSGDTHIETSTDGLTFTPQSTFTPTPGAWTASYPLKPIAIIGGTWYALYGTLLANTFANTHLATSPDGITWTDYVSNPVISALSTYPYACYTQQGSTWYIWMQQGAQNQAVNGVRFFDPTEMVRYSTTDFHTFTGPVHSLRHTQMWECVNTPATNTEACGGNGPIQIFDIGGVATMFHGGSQGDGTGPQVSQFALATSPASIANTVRFNEDATTQVATDNFTRANGPVGANWTAVGAADFKVASNKCEPTNTGTDAQMMYTGAAFTTNLYTEMTIATQSDVVPCGPMLSNLAGTLKLYTGMGTISALGTQGYQARILYYDGTTSWAITALVGIKLTAGDVIRLSLVYKGATESTVSLFQNNALIARGNIPAQPTGLYPGMYLKESVAAHTQISLWAGGNAGVLPTYPTGGGIGGSVVAMRRRRRG